MLSVVGCMLLSSAAAASLQSWQYIRAAAGPLPPRLSTTEKRLFDSAAAEVIFWRDAAGWCPFCEMTWLMLERLQLPYIVRTVPLRRYMRPGEEKDPTYLAMVGPDGVVPGVQFREADGNFGAAIQSIELIFAEFERRYPERYPYGDAAVRACACEGDASIFARLRIARRSYEACAGAADGPGKAALGRPLEDALRDLDTLLATGGGGPYLGGASEMAVADLMLLPLLERTAAVVPYFFGAGALNDTAASGGGVPFGRALRYLAGVRAESLTYRALCSDATTLARTNLRYSEAGAAPRYSVPLLVADETAAGEIDGTATSVRDAWAAEATDTARREAAARLSAQPAKVAAFAMRCSLPADACADTDATDSAEVASAATEDALRAVASMLVGGAISTEGRDGAPTASIAATAQSAADAVRHAHGADAAARGAAALEALSLNVGVPRDMGVEAARALRSHCRLVAEALRSS